jgi:hypothetical protein
MAKLKKHTMDKQTTMMKKHVERPIKKTKDELHIKRYACHIGVMVINKTSSVPTIVKKWLTNKPPLPDLTGILGSIFEGNCDGAGWKAGN